MPEITNVTWEVNLKVSRQYILAAGKLQSWFPEIKAYLLDKYSEAEQLDWDNIRAFFYELNRLKLIDDKFVLDVKKFRVTTEE